MADETSRDKTVEKPVKGTKDAPSAKQKALNEALRKNLQRRKAQARARRAPKN